MRLSKIKGNYETFLLKAKLNNRLKGSDLPFRIKSNGVYICTVGYFEDLIQYPAYKGTILETSAKEFICWWNKGKAIDHDSFIKKARALFLLQDAVLADCRLNESLKNNKYF